MKESELCLHFSSFIENEMWQVNEIDPYGSKGIRSDGIDHAIKQVFIFREEVFNLPMLSQWCQMTENANIS